MEDFKIAGRILKLSGVHMTSGVRLTGWSKQEEVIHTGQNTNQKEVKSNENIRMKRTVENHREK